MISDLIACAVKLGSYCSFQLLEIQMNEIEKGEASKKFWNLDTEEDLKVIGA